MAERELLPPDFDPKGEYGYTLHVTATVKMTLKRNMLRKDADELISAIEEHIIGKLSDAALEIGDVDEVSADIRAE